MLDGEGPAQATPFYYQLDHLGTPQELTAYSGEIMWSAKYRAYGNLAALAGRFLTPDPIKLAGGLNNYQYVPNPTGWVDPLGLMSGKGNCLNAAPPLTQSQIEEITAIPKGSRPNPSEYLSSEYISNHLAQFDSGASRFMTQANLDKYGIGQRDGTSFIMPKTEADKLLASMKGNAPGLENALGLPPGFLESNKLVRVDITNPRELNLRIPSGNEAGANDLWIPGGKLPNGNTEAVIDIGGTHLPKLEVSPIDL
ncbi:RHS repeat-associated protein [Pseudomonas chlororaphis]